MKILVPSKGPDSWRELLRQPATQWRDGYSAKELARAWESAAGFPPEVSALFRSSGVPALREATPLLAIPEHQVPLPGGDASSQNDLFVLASGRGQLIAVTVESKVAEPFAEPLSKWLQDPSPGKLERIAYLKSVVGLAGDLSGELRYQLLHRAASALIEAHRFSARFAVLLVHSFSPTAASLPDFERFLLAFGANHEPGQLVQLGTPGGVPLFAGWAQGRLKS
ncbi:MAG: hypothetical protein L0191_02095 [Acidobacteria bacterium]|nr:hypothetical protein [Acidobacteriota bacterium]